MPKKKPPKEPPHGPPSLADLRTKDLLRSIRDDLAEQAKKSGLVGQPETPPDQPKPRRSR